MNSGASNYKTSKKDYFEHVLGVSGGCIGWRIKMRRWSWAMSLLCICLRLERRKFWRNWGLMRRCARDCTSLELRRLWRLSVDQDFLWNFTLYMIAPRFTHLNKDPTVDMRPPIMPNRPYVSVSLMLVSAAVNRLTLPLHHRKSDFSALEHR